MVSGEKAGDLLDADGARRGVSILVTRIINGHQAVLLVERGREPHMGKWSLPGGRLETGETPLDAARRELLEETGLQAGHLLPIGTREVIHNDSVVFRLACFRVDEVPGEPVAGDDASAAQFVLPADIPRLAMVPGVPEFIALHLT